MTLTEWQAELDGYLIGPTSPWTVRHIEGIGPLDVRTDDTVRAGGDGIQFGRDTLPERVITLTLMADAGTPAALRAAQAALAAAARISRSGARLLRWRLPGEDTRRTWVRPRRRHIEIGEHLALGYGDAILQLVAARPELLADAESSRTLTASGSVTQASGILTAGGDSPAWPVITITGPCRDPRITHNTAGRSIRTQIDVQVDQTLVIDVGNATVHLDGIPVFGAIRPDSEWWTVQPGSQTMLYVRASSGLRTAASSATITWRDTWGAT